MEFVEEIDEVVTTLFDFFNDVVVFGHNSWSGSSSGLSDISAIIPLSENKCFLDEKSQFFNIAKFGGFYFNLMIFWILKISSKNYVTPILAF